MADDSPKHSEDELEDDEKDEAKDEEKGTDGKNLKGISRSTSLWVGNLDL